jgi:hypothetical protein
MNLVRITPSNGPYAALTFAFPTIDSSETDDDDHFSDASEGRSKGTLSGNRSPVAPTQIGTGKSSTSVSETQGIDVRSKRAADTTTDEVEVISERGVDEPGASDVERSLTPGGQPIPRTMVEKIDPSSPRHHEMSGMRAYEVQQASDLSIPITRASKLDPAPNHDGIPRADAHELQSADMDPDVTERKGETGTVITSLSTKSSHLLTESVSPTSPGARSLTQSHVRQNPSSNWMSGSGPGIDSPDKNSDDEEVQEEGNDGFGDDFDDFEEGGEGHDDFGDFDDGFQAAPANEQVQQQSHSPPHTLVLCVSQRSHGELHENASKLITYEHLS